MAFAKAKVCVFPDQDVKSKKTLFEENLDNGKIVNADTVIYPSLILILKQYWNAMIMTGLTLQMLCGQKRKYSRMAYILYHGLVF